MSRARKSLIYFVLWSLLILVLTGIPGNYIPKPQNFLRLFSPDKIVHLLMFAPFAVLFLRFLYSLESEILLKKFPVFSTLIIGIIYATGTELLQIFVFIGRSGNVYDAVADTVGVLLGILFFNKRMKTKDLKGG